METLDEIISLDNDYLYFNNTQCMGNEKSIADYSRSRDGGNWGSLDAAGIIYDRNSSNLTSN